MVLKSSPREYKTCTPQATSIHLRIRGPVHDHVEKGEILQSLHALTCELNPLSNPAWR